MSRKLGLISLVILRSFFTLEQNRFIKKLDEILLATYFGSPNSSIIKCRNIKTSHERNVAKCSLKLCLGLKMLLNQFLLSPPAISDLIGQFWRCAKSFPAGIGSKLVPKFWRLVGLRKNVDFFISFGFTKFTWQQLACVRSSNPEAK